MFYTTINNETTQNQRTIAKAICAASPFAANTTADLKHDQSEQQATHFQGQVAAPAPLLVQRGTASKSSAQKVKAVNLHIVMFLMLIGLSAVCFFLINNAMKANKELLDAETAKKTASIADIWKNWYEEKLAESAQKQRDLMRRNMSVVVKNINFSIGKNGNAPLATAEENKNKIEALVTKTEEAVADYKEKATWNAQREEERKKGSVQRLAEAGYDQLKKVVADPTLNDVNELTDNALNAFPCANVARGMATMGGNFMLNSVDFVCAIPSAICAIPSTAWNHKEKIGAVVAAYQTGPAVLEAAANHIIPATINSFIPK